MELTAPVAAPREDDRPDAPGRHLRLLLVEDSEDDALLVVRELRRGGHDVSFDRVETEAELRAALRQGGWDAVISDYSMPSFSGLQALDHLQQAAADVPFIIVSGAIGEGAAVALMKAGAHDYVGKGDLRRLVPALERELREAEGRRRQAQAETALAGSEQRFRALVQNSSDVFAVVDGQARISYVGPSMTRMLGYDPDELIGSVGFGFVHPDDLERAVAGLTDVVTIPEVPAAMTLRVRHADGSWRHVEFILTNLIHEPAVAGVVANLRDVSERARAEEALREQGRVARFAADVGAAFTAQVSLDEILQACAGAMVEHLDAAFGRIWTLSESGDELELRASAGLYAHVDGAHARVPVGRFKIGLIAAERRPHLTNQVLGDPRVHDQEWAEREGMVAFAGYPLVVADRLVGVMALFARQPLTDTVLDAMATVAGQIAVGIEGRQAEKQLRARARQQEAVARLGLEALRAGDLDGLLHLVVTTVAGTLDAELTKVLELLPGGDELLLRAGAGWADDLVGTARVPARAASQAAYTLGAAAPVIVDDFATETRLAPPALLADHDVVSGMSVAISGPDGPWGVLGVHSRRRRVFTPDDASFLQATANVLAGAIHRQRAEDRLRDQAIRDPLTGLPNRTLLQDRIDHALSRSERRGIGAAVMFCDLDHFKVVNDGYGHPFGDRLLVEVARRLAAAVRPADTVARFGGDEFVLVFEDVATDAEAVALAARVQAAFEAPFDLDGRRLFVAISIGIARSHPGASSAESLLRQADAAVYQAKEQGRGRAEVFDEGLQRRAEQRLATEAALRRALDQEEFFVVYQPIVALDSGGIVGAEALVRWLDPDRGSVAPAEFIPMAEQTGLIVPLDTWVLREACRQARAWEAEGVSAPSLSVNLSARHLQTPDLVATVARALEEAGMPPERLTLELTETVLMDDVERSLGSLHGLKALGVGLAVDDFGTGYSSLSYLKRLPVNTLKIDRSFVDGLSSPSQDASIVAAVVALGRSLGLTVLAEGVETAEQLAALRALGCDLAQGYYFARPLPAPAFAGLLESALRW